MWIFAVLLFLLILFFFNDGGGDIRKYIQVQLERWEKWHTERQKNQRILSNCMLFLTSQNYTKRNVLVQPPIVERVWTNIRAIIYGSKKNFVCFFSFHKFFIQLIWWPASVLFFFCFWTLCCCNHKKISFSIYVYTHNSPLKLFFISNKEKWKKWKLLLVFRRMFHVNIYSDWTECIKWEQFSTRFIRLRMTCIWTFDFHCGYLLLPSLLTFCSVFLYYKMKE